ncbi:MAG TPA: CBS domain-containing protein [Thermoanaerobaculia bacterium]|nr:CBS domain-containing protein [Thermoanaerobaculia bacterium]
MTPSPICCRPDDNVEQVARLMAEHDCGAIPVCVDGKVIGMITDRDVTCRVVAAGKPPARLAASEIMSRTIYTVAADAEIEVAIDGMKTHQVRRLPVVNADDQVVGIISPSDLAPTFASAEVADFLLAVSYWTRRPSEARPAEAGRTS